MPKRRHHNVLDCPCFAIGQLHLGFLFLLTSTVEPSANNAGLFWTFAWTLAAIGTGLWRYHLAFTWLHTAFLAWFVVGNWLPIPFGVAEMEMGFYEVVDRKIVLAIE